MIVRIHHYSDSTRRGRTLCGELHQPVELNLVPLEGETAICPGCDAEWTRRREEGKR